MASTNMSWKKFIWEQVLKHCNEIGYKTFSLQDFMRSKLAECEKFNPNYKDTKAKIRQQLQVLRDDGKIVFLDNTGNYTLTDTDLLNLEKEDLQTIDLTKESPEKREYLIETYIRKAKWSVEAKARLGDKCLGKHCDNSFTKENGSLYIEVHHIVPLAYGGENVLANLSVLCAHHHRMAHFADSQCKTNFQKYLLAEVRARL